MAALLPGTRAPDFSLPCTPDQKLRLSDFTGENIVLIFYPADWSPVCGDELAIYNEIHDEFKSLNARLIAISVDGPWCHNAFSKDRHFQFPLVSDFHPKAEVSKAYGVYRENDGVSERALFVIDREGMIAWSYVSPIGVNPGADGVLTALENLNQNSEEKLYAHGKS